MNDQEEAFEQEPESEVEKEQLPEGYDDTKNQGLGDDYPLDSVMVHTKVMSVSDVAKRIHDKRLIMDPDFQRDFVWEPSRQSRLIESCIMRIPLPVLYLAEAKDGRNIVVDGLQRLTTLYLYTENKFGLSGLGKGEGESKKNNPLLKKKFKDLPVHLQERIADTQLTLYILDKNAPARAKLDIFDRVNSGIPLSRQQMRNSLYSGPATNWLKERSKSDSFLSATGKSLNKKSMRDREAINRFCGFCLLKDSYKGDMDTFLADTLEHMNGMNQQALDELAERFEISMNNNFLLFGEHAFRKSFSTDTTESRRKVINIALFDVFSVLLSELDKNFIEKNRDDLLEKFDDLTADQDFINSISLATNDTKKVAIRFDKIRSILDSLDYEDLV